MYSETVIEYIIRISGNSNKITRLVEYLTTVSDKDNLLCKVRSTNLFYDAVPRFFASGVFSSIRSDYDIKPRITNHFLARLFRLFCNRSFLSAFFRFPDNGSIILRF